MDIKNQQGDHVAKQKNVQKSNPKKVMQGQIREIGNATEMLIQELRVVNQNLLGLENLIFHLSNFLGKKKDFETYITKELKRLDKEKAKIKSIDGK